MVTNEAISWVFINYWSFRFYSGSSASQQKENNAEEQEKNNSKPLKFFIFLICCHGKWLTTALQMNRSEIKFKRVRNINSKKHANISHTNSTFSPFQFYVFRLDVNKRSPGHKRVLMSSQQQYISSLLVGAPTALCNAAVMVQKISNIDNHRRVNWCVLMQANSPRLHPACVNGCRSVMEAERWGWTQHTGDKVTTTSELTDCLSRIFFCQQPSR